MSELHFKILSMNNITEPVWFGQCAWRKRNKSLWHLHSYKWFCGIHTHACTRCSFLFNCFYSSFNCRVVGYELRFYQSHISPWIILIYSHWCLQANRFYIPFRSIIAKKRRWTRKKRGILVALWTDCYLKQVDWSEGNGIRVTATAKSKIGWKAKNSERCTCVCVCRYRQPLEEMHVTYGTLQ